MNRKASGNAGVLGRILEHKRTEVAQLVREAVSWRAAAERAPLPPAFAPALQGGSCVAVIGEIKRRSPSAGALGVDLRERAAAYAVGGAVAISVLTDAPFFGGSTADLESVRQVVGLPLLRKDFTIDPVQVWQAKAVGASAVLLIARILDDAQLAALTALAEELGLSALVEVHGEAELGRALAAGARIVGVNNRDLDTLTIDLGTTLRLAREVPRECVLVAESGIGGVAQVAELARAGVDAVLVGEALMRAGDPAGALRRLASVARERRS